ncbi:MAG: toll/interleukin-1 receptor domain-containing protein [Isosphaeraceae bacterium]
MPEKKLSFDVFISHSHRDAAVSAEITRVLRSYDLKVFMDADVGVAQAVEDLIWEAMSESQALVAVIPETDPSAWSAFELGAAKAWNKPIYAVATNPATARLPVGLHGVTIYPPSRIDEIAQEIKKASGSLTDSDEAILIEEYHRIGVPVDQLVLEPKQLSTLTKQFKKRTKRHAAAEELVRALLRLRKRGRLRQLHTTNRPEAV